MATAEERYRDFLAGDEEAFEELVYQFRQPITAFVYRILPDSHAAQDVAQDVFVEVLEKRRFRFEAGLRSWLFAIARNKAIDYIRRNRRTIPFEEFHRDAEETPEEQVLARERRERAKAALRQLKDDRRMALLLTAAQGLSYEEAAAVLHKTPDQIRNLCYRGRQQLKQTMKEVDGDDQ